MRYIARDFGALRAGALGDPLPLDGHQPRKRLAANPQRLACVPDFFRQNLRGRLVRCVGKLYFDGATNLQSA
jgi:hypothetical protein